MSRLTRLRIGPHGTNAAADCTLVKKGTFTLDPANILANVNAEQAITIADAAVGDIFQLSPPSNLSGGLAFTSGYCLVAGTMRFKLINPTAGALDAPSGTWTYIQQRYA